LSYVQGTWHLPHKRHYLMTNDRGYEIERLNFFYHLILKVKDK
jgi:hypothetical protein